MAECENWLKQELDELDEAQKMIYDAISTFEPTNGNTATLDLKETVEVSNSQPVSDADRSVAELLSSLNIETDSSTKKKNSFDDLPPPPALDDLIIEQIPEVIEAPAPTLPKMNKSTPPPTLPKPSKKGTAVSTVKIQLSGKPKGHDKPEPMKPITIVAPVEEPVQESPAKPVLPPKVAESPKPEEIPAPVNIPAPKPAPVNIAAPKPAPAPAPKPVPDAVAAPPPASNKFPTLSLGDTSNNGTEKTLADLENDLDFYTKTLLSNVENPKDEEFYGYCGKCNGVVEGEQVGCKAFDQIFHISCFNCETCKKSVHGVQFYAVEQKPYCEKCYMDSLEKCAVCKNQITDKILRASGTAYHPDCFKCSVCCKSLDGIPFTMDDDKSVYCVDCYYKKYAPKCSVCGEAILPEAGKEETIRIVALERDFHVGCYKCEKCQILLSSGDDGKGCYPLDGKILCLNCNTMTAVQ